MTIKKKVIPKAKAKPIKISDRLESISASLDRLDTSVFFLRNQNINLNRILCNIEPQKYLNDIIETIEKDDSDIGNALISLSNKLDEYQGGVLYQLQHIKEDQRIFLDNIQSFINKPPTKKTRPNWEMIGFWTLTIVLSLTAIYLLVHLLGVPF